jgi:hypothetical protein
MSGYGPGEEEESNSRFYLKDQFKRDSQTLHWACGHEYIGFHTPSVIKKHLWDDRLDSGRFARQGLTVMHPRWCDECIMRRSKQIYCNHTFVEKGYRGVQRDNEMFQLAWNVGVRQGRIEALNINLQEPDPKTPPRCEFF